MKYENQLRLKLKNAEGRRMIEANRLEYCRKILMELEQNPGLLPCLLESLEITEDDFITYISGGKTANVTMYDQTLVLLKKNRNSNYGKDSKNC